MTLRLEVEFPLMFNLAQFRRTSFIALLAMVMLALAPTVSKT